MILAADIGATTSHLALFSSDGSLLRVESYRTREHDRVAELVARFLRTIPGAHIDSACVGVTVPWAVYAHELAEVFEIPAVVVVDGLEARVHRLRDLARIAAERLVVALEQKATSVA
jgi:predicted NBD/HSP70 family sugar kinase